MQAPERVVWSEGMFLSPQHFQQQDLYHERRSAKLVEWFASDATGVVNLEIDKPALRSGTFRIMQFAALLPGGLLVEWGSHSADAPAGRPMASLMSEHAQKIDVYVGVPREREGIANVGVQGEHSSRFKRVARSVPELTQAATPPIVVTYARPHLQIFGEHELDDDYELFKVAEVVRGVAGTFCLVDDYVPACLHIAAASALLPRLSDVLVQLQTLTGHMAAQFRTRKAAAAPIQMCELGLFLAWQGLNVALPALKAALRDPSTSPRRVFLALCEVLGALNVLQPGDSSFDVCFDSHDLRGCFGQAFHHIERVLKLDCAANAASLNFEPDTSGVLQIELPAAAKDAASMVVAVTPGGQVNGVAESFPRVAKLSACRDLRHIVQAAAAGIPMRHCTTLPPGVVARAGVVHFEVEITHPLWRSALEDGRLSLFVPPSLLADPKSRFELIVSPRS